MTDEIHYGEAAVRESCINSSIAYKEVKCIIGVLLILLQSTTCKWPFDLCGKPYSYLMTVNYDNIPIGYAYPEYINALFLSYLVNFASEKIDMEIKDVVITVPAFFSAVQLYSTLQTTRLAGLNVLHILPEPCAVTLPYCLVELFILMSGI